MTTPPTLDKDENNHNTDYGGKNDNNYVNSNDNNDDDNDADDVIEGNLSDVCRSSSS